MPPVAAYILSPGGLPSLSVEHCPDLWPLTYLTEVTNKLGHSPYTLSCLPNEGGDSIKRDQAGPWCCGAQLPPTAPACALCSSWHALEHYTCTASCLREVPTHFKWLPRSTLLNYISLKQLIIMQIVLNFCSISVISNWSSECIFVTPVHCLYSTVKLVAHGGAWGKVWGGPYKERSIVAGIDRCSMQETSRSGDHHSRSAKWSWTERGSNTVERLVSLPVFIR